MAVVSHEPRALEVSKFLRERITDPVLELNPLDASNSPLEIDPSLTTYLSTANAGAALEYRSGKLAINLQSPKKPPKPRNRFVTYGALGGLAAAACLTGYYFLLSDVWSLEEEHRTALQTLDNQKKVTAKYHEKADQVLAVENWMSDRVDWLAELNRLSQRLPQGSQATIRRLSASTKNDEAYIDLSVQVAEQETVSQLEQGIRSAKYSVTSKQISQNAESAEYPWQFETQIHFPIEAESTKPSNKQTSKGSAKPASSKAPSKDARREFNMTPRMRWLLIAALSIFGLYGADSIYRSTIEEPTKALESQIDSTWIRWPKTKTINSPLSVWARGSTRMLREPLRPTHNSQNRFINNGCSNSSTNTNLCRPRSMQRKPFLLKFVLVPRKGKSKPLGIASPFQSMDKQPFRRLRLAS